MSRCGRVGRGLGGKIYGPADSMQMQVAPPIAPLEGIAYLRVMLHWRTGLPLVGLYVLLALVPLFVGLGPPTPAGRAFWLELSVALGFVGMGQLALQFALIARFRGISEPFGIDLVMQYHRQIGILAVLLVLAHPAVLIAWRPSYGAILNPFEGDWAGRAGILATVAIVGLVVTSLWRRRLGLGYETWRVLHALLGIAAIGLAQFHVSTTGLYVATPWKHAVLVAWSAAFVGLIVHLRLVKPLDLSRRRWRVAEVRPEAAETWSLAIEPDGHDGLAFSAGQFAWLKIGRSPWSVEEHPFSFSSSTEDPSWVEFGIKELGDFTRRIGRVPVGTLVFLDGPHGSFSCDFQPADAFLFIAGGIGISPVISMLRSLADREDRRPMRLVYAASRWDRVAFRDDIDGLARRLDLGVVHVLEERHEGWTGPTGYITGDVLEAQLAGLPSPRVFLCGPDPMMTHVERLLLDRGVRHHDISMERFHLV